MNNIDYKYKKYKEKYNKFKNKLVELSGGGIINNDLITYIQTKYPTTLNLSNSSLAVPFDILCNSIKLNDSITTLNLRKSSVLTESVLVDIFLSPDRNTSITHLNLSSNNLQLGEKIVFLHSDVPGVIGGKAVCSMVYIIGKIIQNNNIIELNLSNTNLSSTDMEYLYQCLRIDGVNNLQILDVSNNNLDDTCCVHICEYINSSTNIININLGNNGFSDICLNKIIDAVIINNTIQSIDLTFNKIKMVELQTNYSQDVDIYTYKKTIYYPSLITLISLNKANLRELIFSLNIYNSLEIPDYILVLQHAISNNPYINSIGLTSTTIPYTNFITLLQNIQTNQNIRSVNLSHINIVVNNDILDNMHPECINAINSMIIAKQNLHRLCISNCKINDSMFLGSLFTYRNIRHLDISYPNDNSWTNEDYINITTELKTNITTFNTLERLNLSGFNFKNIAPLVAALNRKNRLPYLHIKLKDIPISKNDARIMMSVLERDNNYIMLDMSLTNEENIKDELERFDNLKLFKLYCIQHQLPGLNEVDSRYSVLKTRAQKIEQLLMKAVENILMNPVENIAELQAELEQNKLDLNAVYDTQIRYSRLLHIIKFIL
jgi:hypothetical protein